MSVGESSLLAIFGLWFGVSAFCQIPSQLSKRIQKLDFLSLRPSWSFFAPTPSTIDLHLLVRNRLANGRVSEWREVRAATGRPMISFSRQPVPSGSITTSKRILLRLFEHARSSRQQRPRAGSAIAPGQPAP
jgi:hypothetical protein